MTLVRPEGWPDGYPAPSPEEWAEAERRFSAEGRECNERAKASGQPISYCDADFYDLKTTMQLMGPICWAHHFDSLAGWDHQAETRAAIDAIYGAKEPKS